MMSLSMTVGSLFFLLISGVVAQNTRSVYWGVYYSPESICVLKGSTVTMGCNYIHPLSAVISKTFWTTEPDQNKTERPDLSSDPEYTDRVQYLGNKWSNCSLRLRDVTEKDQRKFYFMFLTAAEGNWQGKSGVQLFVTDLQVEIPDMVMEGGDVTLTCKTTCDLTGPTYTWYKNGFRLTSNTNHLHLNAVSRNDAGSYSCAVGNHTSSAISLDVRCLSVTAYITVGVSICGAGCLLIIVFWKRRKNQNMKLYENTSQIVLSQTVHFTQPDGTYTPLDLHTGSVDDTYTPLDLHTRSVDDTYTSLDLPTRSVDDTYTALDLHTRSVDDTYTALDLHSRLRNQC